MPAKALLREAQDLKAISQRLELLASDHTGVGHALITISGTILHTATLIEVLVATKLGSVVD